MRIAVVLTLVLPTGCATTMTPAGEKVRIVTEQQRSSCRFIKLVTVRKNLGPDKPGNALKEAMNEAAAAGGNGLFLVTNSMDWIDGASVAGEALDCKS